MISPATYLVVGRHAWNRTTFDTLLCHLPGEWHYTDDPEDLSLERLSALEPRMLFFLHWSRRVPREIVERFECICFHMTDLPFGRGGTPLQNLLIRGFEETTMTAFRMTTELDAGPVYLKAPLSLNGRAEEIYERASNLSGRMIRDIIRQKLEPRAQIGEVVRFDRRTPEESVLPQSPASLSQIHDFIRMLDAAGYPRAFLTWGRVSVEFHHSDLYDDRIEAQATIRIGEE